MKNILELLPGVKENIFLSNYTTYKIGGSARYFFIAKTKEDLIKATKVGKKNKLPIFIFGGGSNILVSEKGFKGLVIKLDNSDIKIEGEKVFVGAGTSLVKLSYMLAENGLSGLEWAAGVPGTVGGAIYGNAHAFGVKICDAVESVEVINTKNLEIKTLTNQDCQFSLKNSIFKNPPAGGKNLIIISAILTFKKETVDSVKNKIKEFLEHRRQRHPMEFPSAGSVFINPSSIPAWQLIKDCGLAGKKIGNAQISEKHPNFIVNLGGAKAKDVLDLIKLTQKEVKKKFKIKLEPEIQLIGF